MKASPQFTHSKIDFPWHFSNMIIPWKMFIDSITPRFLTLDTYGISIFSTETFGSELRSISRRVMTIAWDLEELIDIPFWNKFYIIIWLQYTFSCFGNFTWSIDLNIISKYVTDRDDEIYLIYLYIILSNVNKTKLCWFFEFKETRAKAFLSVCFVLL